MLDLAARFIGLNILEAQERAALYDLSVRVVAENGKEYIYRQDENKVYGRVNLVIRNNIVEKAYLG